MKNVNKKCVSPPALEQPVSFSACVLEPDTKNNF